MWAKFVDKALDLVWDVLEPVAGTCPVCAFLRGLALGLAILLGVLLWR